MKTAIAYCRYSSDNQREESIDAQLRAIRDYAKRNGYHVAKTYIDEAKTATTDNRPQFQKLFKDIKIERYDALIVHKLDRFARDRYDSANYRHKLKENGMVLLSVIENLDGSPESIILESVLEGMAEYYSKNLAREVMKGMRETAFQGRHTGGVPPLGYNVDKDGNYSINESEAAIVRAIFIMYSSGTSYNEMAARLNSEGYTTKTGKKFTKYSFHDLLKNEKYKGTFVFNKTAPKAADGKRNNHKEKSEAEMIRIENRMPQIVDVELWEKVNKIMTGNRRNGEKKAKRVYLLSGLIVCGECESPMSGNTRNCGRNKDEYSTYDCNRRKREKNCMAKSVNKDYVENLVIDYLANDYLTEKNATKIAKKLYEVSKNSVLAAESEIPILRLELSRLESEKRKIVDSIITSGISEWLNERGIEVKTRMEEIQIKIAALEKKKDLEILDVEKIKWFFLKDRYIKDKSPEDQKAIIRTHIEKVVIYHNDIDIHTSVDSSGEGEPLRFVSTINLFKYRHETGHK